jgi:hypothetical protein
MDAGTRHTMWVVYVAMVVLLAVAIGGGALGGPVVAIVAGIPLLALLGFVVFSRLRSAQIDSTAGSGIPSSGESSYEPRVSPEREATGSTTGTPT